MIFIGLFFCVIALILIFIKVWCMVTGKLVEGSIVGYVRGSKGLYGFVGYNYRIRLEYNGEIYYSTSIDGVTVTNGTIPKKNLGAKSFVYFNPKSPKSRVALKGVHRLEWMAFLLLVIGVVSIWLGLILLE
ncbi:DUF3592 domain-containing protein [Ornithinibacillus salinisoli]|uniref:DUF3592 domain-containing protein n=1 Tax=Ornithinibacillus salinisoli TaxID=1848459 RepID=A0ABW4W373_9BACI